jgi:predicted ester cyclase
VLWDAHDTAAIPSVLQGFAEYVDMVHEALGEYLCTILDLVVETPKAFARMRFSGIHVGEFMGFPPTGKPVSWEGAALFTFSGDLIVDAWVLGDLKALEKQLRVNAS